MKETSRHLPNPIFNQVAKELQDKISCSCPIWLYPFTVLSFMDHIVGRVYYYSSHSVWKMKVASWLLISLVNLGSNKLDGSELTWQERLIKKKLDMQGKTSSPALCLRRRSSHAGSDSPPPPNPYPTHTHNDTRLALDLLWHETSEMIFFNAHISAYLQPANLLPRGSGLRLAGCEAHGQTIRLAFTRTLYSLW